ncbi:hypothetical protein SUGI_0201900 [Cryptomeria japonica]|uniref:protein RALF-like 19 n=1 Tax=Cryptomeria japonica TaxID=3369 RepID=UPI002408BCE7|nr:protein RALF-like 19 [Cryptomeria japonica]GLJ12973.1 hypothetical protein SUGI_0201900 [Cryptomeria japonica]
MVADSKTCVGVLLVLLLLMVDLENSVGSTGVMLGDENAMKIPLVYSKKSCDGSMGNCLGDEENKRRVISYDALEGDRVPCSKIGHSYYHCGESGQANPYKRSCTKITHCARDTN